MAQSHLQRLNLGVLAISQFFCLSLWFSTNAVLPQLRVYLSLGKTDIASISSAVILGFVIGGLLSSIFNLSDLIAGPKLFFVSAIFGALANSSITITSDLYLMIFERFLTGFFLAGIYPVGMKLTASHFNEHRGLAIGILLSALTAGSGLPYLFNLTGVPDWELLVNLASVLAVIGGVLVLLLCSEGPYIGKSTEFSIGNIKKIYSKSSVRQANFGYFGHMWELYAFWVWIPVFLEYVFLQSHPGKNAVTFVSIVTFAIFCIGALANIAGGFLADRIGRTLFNGVMLCFSGLSSLCIGLFTSNLTVSVGIALIWGMTIIPDSPQYSSMVTELADSELVGSALTIQTAIGFSLTMVSLRIIPAVLPILGWQWVFTTLTIGPLFGLIAMVRLRNNPESVKIAAGKR